MQIPTLIDNIEGNTLQKVLESLLVKSIRLDIATGNFEIGAFLSLGETWRHLDGIRLLMGDETTKRTKAHLIARWEEASEVKAELLRTIERHLREYPPFTVYAKALHTYFRGREKPADEWEENESVIYRTLSQYQKTATTPRSR